MGMPTAIEMLKAGVHFGHRKSKVNPKMKPYIYTIRNGIYIVDLASTEEKLADALEFIKDIARKKGVILFVGTKTPARQLIEDTAKECGMPYVNNRWVGGSFTNFNTVKKRIDYLLDLEAKKESGELKKYTKKEILEFTREIERLNKMLGGIKKLKKLPDVIFITDLNEDSTAVREARKMNVPIVALADTNTDPTLADYPIPANDDAISSLKLILNAVKEAILGVQNDVETLKKETTQTVQ